MSKSSARLVAVGDVMLGDHPLSLGFGVRSKMLTKGGEYIFKSVKNLLRNSDICFANLECVLSNTGFKARSIGSLEMRGSPAFASVLRNAGINAMSIANNHIMQHGYKAFDDTIKVLSQVGIKAIGLKDAKGHCMAREIKVNGLKIFFLGYSLHPEKYASQVGYANGPKCVILDDIKRIKTLCDLVIVSLHWGDEFVVAPSIQQIDLGHACIEEGASLVLGHHPHILQGIEQYGKGLIAYSLGNFVFDFWQKRLRETIILKCNLSRDGVESFEVIPMRIDSDYRPLQMVDEDANRFKGKLHGLSYLIAANHTNPATERRAYLKEVQRQEFRNKVESRLFFLRNLICLRYKAWVVGQSLWRFLLNRR
jgi:gamma-polyglutamate biosynthesis protein CapA